MCIQSDFQELTVYKKNSCNAVPCKVDEQILRKDVLSLEEIQALINCHYDSENPNVRRAFIFYNIYYNVLNYFGCVFICYIELEDALYLLYVLFTSFFKDV